MYTFTGEHLTEVLGDVERHRLLSVIEFTDGARHSSDGAAPANILVSVASPDLLAPISYSPWGGGQLPPEHGLEPIVIVGEGAKIGALLSQSIRALSLRSHGLYFVMDQLALLEPWRTSHGLHLRFLIKLDWARPWQSAQAFVPISLFSTLEWAQRRKIQSSPC